MNDRNEHIQKEMERLALLREKSLQQDFNARVRSSGLKEVWESADSVFTPEEQAGQLAEWRRGRLFLRLDLAAFAGSVFFMGWAPPKTAGLQMLLIGCAVLSFFGIFVFFFLLRSTDQGFAHEHRLRLEARKETTP